MFKKRDIVGVDGVNKKFTLAPHVPLLKKPPLKHAFVGSLLSLSVVQLPVNLGLGGEGEEGFALGYSGNQALLGVGGCYDPRLSFKTFQSLAISEGSHVAVGIPSKATDMLNVNAFSHP